MVSKPRHRLVGEAVGRALLNERPAGRLEGRQNFEHMVAVEVVNDPLKDRVGAAVERLQVVVQTQVEAHPLSGRGQHFVAEVFGVEGQLEPLPLRLDLEENRHALHAHDPPQRVPHHLFVSGYALVVAGVEIPDKRERLRKRKRRGRAQGEAVCFHASSQPRS
jgi:hypothetical protein